MFILTAILVACAFHHLEPLEYGIRVNTYTQTVYDEFIKQGGRHLLGFGQKFVRFPARRYMIAYVDGLGDTEDSNIGYIGPAEGLEKNYAKRLKFHFKLGFGIQNHPFCQMFLYNP